jgi:hypothetical protein
MGPLTAAIVNTYGGGGVRPNDPVFTVAAMSAIIDAIGELERQLNALRGELPPVSATDEFEAAALSDQ